MACEDALETTGIGRRFKDYLNVAIEQKAFAAINWGSGIWQKISLIHKLRKDFVHVNPSQDALFPEADEADNAIEVIREAIKDIYARAGRDAPSWVEDDYDQGWDKGWRSIAHATMTRREVDPNAADTIRVGYIYKDREHISEVLPAGTDLKPVIEQLLRDIRVPISRVRAYKGNELIVDREISMRGT
ncbi:MAG: hypothetical protein ABIF87_05610 [Pseudomonadota bacterium]